MSQTFPVGFSYMKKHLVLQVGGVDTTTKSSKSRRQSKVNDSISPPKKGL